MEIITYGNRMSDANTHCLTEDFTIIPNSLLRDPKVKDRTKILLFTLLSNKKGWVSYIDSIKETTGHGFNSIDNSLSELESLKYLKRIKYRNKKTKRWEGSFWAYSDIPNHFDISDHIKKLEELNMEIPNFKKMQSEINLITAYGHEHGNHTYENHGDGRPSPWNRDSNNTKTNTNKNTNTNTNSFLKKRRIRFSDENHNVSNSEKRIKPKTERKTRNKLQAEERKSKMKYRRKDIRQKTNITKIPPYVIDLIEQWNSYPNTTSHRINKEEPSKTIKQIHRYFIQLRAGKMSGLDPAWKKRCKIPDKKYSIDELKQGIEYLSKFSQNDYWPQEKAPWTKNLPALLYNKENGKSLFMQVIQIPPKKLSEMKKIQYPSLVEKFTKAKIWEKAPNQHELDKVIHGLVSFWEHLQRWSKDPNIRQLVYYRLYEQYYTGYIGFLEGSSIILNDVWMLGINKWPFREYMEECQEILYYRGVTDIKPAELLKRFIDKS